MARTLEQRGRRLATCGPILLRRPSRRFFRRLVFVGGLVAVLAAAPGAAGLQADDTPPVVVARYFGTPGSNSWYTSDLTVNWGISDPEGPILDWDPVGCAPFTLNFDHPGTIRTCWAQSAGGKTTVETKVLKVDKTPPVVSAAATRPPDANGWYNHALTFAFAGADGMSGIASCSPAAGYGGPDNASASVAGSCRDNAGNNGAGALSFRYDATPPTVANLRTTSKNREAQLTWSISPDTQVVEIRRAPGRNRQAETVIFRGLATSYRDAGLTVGRHYHYRVSGFDIAANSASQGVGVTAAGALFSPGPAERVTKPPRLIWTALKGIRYYNLQLIRGGRRVLSAWPVRPYFQLKRSWTYKGRRYKLQRGTYRWYVWPGKGRISAGRYGEMLGSSTFVVAG
jgi:hypothetical protein